MSELDQYTRWDKTHTKSIKVFYQQEPSEYLREDRKALGVDVITCNPMVAEMFGVVVDDKEDSILKLSILDALQRGDHVFYIEFGEHSAYWCHLHDSIPKRSWDSGFCGVVIVRRDAWFKAMPRSTFARSYVSKVLHLSWDEQMTAYLNGWFYEANIQDPDNDLDYWMGDFLSPEEAIKVAQMDHPEVVYSITDFEEVRLCTLKVA